MKKISDLRKNKNGMTQKELAKELNVSQASISMWEDNPLIISGKNLVKLSKVLDVSVDDILGVWDEENGED